MRGGLSWCLAAALLAACALPAFEIDPNFGAAGAAGSSGSTGSAGTAGTAGNAGGTGGDAGGSGDDFEATCLEYCSIYIAACTGHEANTYANQPDCLGACATSGWPFGEVTEEGNSLQCRHAHAIFARNQGPNPHCYHASEFPSMGNCEP